MKTGIDTQNIIGSIRKIIEKQKKFKNGKLSKILGNLLISYKTRKIKTEIFPKFHWSEYQTN